MQRRYVEGYSVGKSPCYSRRAWLITPYNPANHKGRTRSTQGLYQNLQDLLPSRFNPNSLAS